MYDVIVNFKIMSHSVMSSPDEFLVFQVMHLLMLVVTVYTVFVQHVLDSHLSLGLHTFLK